ncbi:MAG: spore cortex biosynthesis protein YabQ [Clostridia bacterium]|nr:spore cortex biosynthesis protein YabQ [Clostridia bacterium]
MWEINNTSQAISFLYSIILGILFAIIYDFFRSLRKCKQHTILLVFIEDILYFLILAVITFIFLLALTNGQVRAYILIGILLGFLLFVLTLSKYYIIVMCFLLKLFFKLLDLISKGFYIIIGKMDCFITDFFKNTLKCLKKGLKKLVCLLYTNKKSN